MIVQTLLEMAAANSGITDSTTIYEFLNQAAQELWDSEDFPGTLEEESFKPYDEGQAFVSLPYYIQSVRGVRPCVGMTTDVMHKATAVMDDQYIMSPWRWREVKRTPLIRDLEEASQLTIKRVLPTAADEVIISIAGPSDVADRAEENIIFTANDSEKQTEIPYETLDNLSKNVISECNFEVYDSAGNLVAVLPNHYLSVHNIVIQLTNTCSCVTPTSNCVLVLYKPYLPPLLREGDPIPAFMEQALYWKFREWLDLHSTDKLERSSVMLAKSVSSYSKSAYNVERGLTKPINVRRSPFTPFAGHRL